jgi:hypothetical protein
METKENNNLSQNLLMRLAVKGYLSYKKSFQKYVYFFCITVIKLVIVYLNYESCRSLNTDKMFEDRIVNLSIIVIL